MNVNSLSFGSRHINTTNIVKKDSKKDEPLDFVEFEPTFYDLTRLYITTNSYDRKSNVGYGRRIFQDYVEAYNRNGGAKKFFGLEDNDGGIQAIAEATDGKDANLYLDYLYVNPKNCASSKNKKYSNLGSKCFSEIIKFAKDNKNDKIVFFNAQKDFWKKIPNLEGDLFCVLENKDFDKCSKALDERA